MIGKVCICASEHCQSIAYLLKTDIIFMDVTAGYYGLKVGFLK